MKPPKTVKLRDLKRILASYGISYGGGGKHMMLRAADGKKYPMPYTKDSDDVERSYVNALRRCFRLTPEDGVSHEEFYGRR